MLEKSEIYWCDNCNIPLYSERCSCGMKGRRIATDMRPVFPEERLLLEILLQCPFAYEKASVWNGSGNQYFINGKRVDFSVKALQTVDTDAVREKYKELKSKNTYRYFNRYIERFTAENKERLDEVVNEATAYILETTKGYNAKDMFVSFSGGKDSTVVSSLVMRALSEPRILHIFGDTTLEFPETMNYVQRFKENHPKTPVISSKNKDKDFEELCRLVGPPSRVMRWCCTVFKTGAIQRKIQTLFREKDRIVTFYGIRRSESASRNKYEREAEGSKIAKQITVSPIIDWIDFDIWLYLLSMNIDFNAAYRWGYTRVGCWCCPNNSKWSEFLSQIYMPEQYGRWRTFLIDFATKIGKPDAQQYVDDGKWKARQGGNGVEYAGRAVIAFQPCALEENTFSYELQRPIGKELYDLFRPFGYIDQTLGNERLGEVYITKKNGSFLLKLQGRQGSKNLKITIYDHHLDGAQNIEAAEEKMKCQLTKYQLCMGCKACESICRHDAITIREDGQGNVRYTIDDMKCVRCAECVNHYTGGCYIRKVLATKRQ